MKRIVCLAIGVSLSAPAAYAQAGPGGGQPVGIAAGMQAAYNRIKGLLVASADKLSEADYTFKPTNEIRGYGQLWGHVANFQYGQCAQVKGVPNPNQGNNLEQTATTKAAVVKALADSFAFCDDAFASLTDANAVEFVKQGQNEVARASVLAGLITHSNEEYGTMVPYMRLKGVVPPSTERAQAATRKPGQ